MKQNSSTLPATSAAGFDTGAPAQPIESSNLFVQLAFFFWLIAIVVDHSRIFDLVARGFKIPLILILLLFFFFALSGRVTRGLRTRTGITMVLLVCWVSVTMLFSIWKSGSIPSYESLIDGFLFFMIGAGLLETAEDVRKSMTTLAVSGLIAVLLSFKFGQSTIGRFSLDSGSYADPNYYSMWLLAVLPFFWNAAAQSKSWVVKVFAVLGSATVFYVVSKTGSRGAMVGFAVMMLVLFFLSSFFTRIMLAGLTVLALLATVSFVPDYVRARYMTFFSVNQEEMNRAAAEARLNSPGGGASDMENLNADVDSAEARKQLLLTSISMTLRNPIFGVGPGDFPVAVFDGAKAEGRRSEWLTTHNSYTQISSETGFPGFILFVLVICFSLGNVIFVLRRTRPRGETPDFALYNNAKFLLLSLTLMFTCMFFLSEGYDLTNYIWVGIAASLSRIAGERKPAVETELAAANLVVPVSYEPPAKVGNGQPAPERPTARKAPQETTRSVRFNRYR